MRCQGNSLIPILELRCIFSFNKWSSCSGGGSEARLGDSAGQPLAASRGAPASSEIGDRVASFSTEEKTIRAVRAMLGKRQADAALQLPLKVKSKPSQPRAPPPEHPSSESPEGERPSKKAKSCAQNAAIGPAPSSGSQGV